MDEYSTPPVIDADPTENLNDLLAARVASAPDGVMIERQDVTGGPWSAVTAREFDAEVVALAKGLVARGIAPGDRVGIMSRTRYEWTLLDWAIWAAGAIPVPLYETSSTEQILWILTDSDVSLVIAETTAHAASVAEVRPEAPSVTEVLVIDDGAIATLVAGGGAVTDEEIARRRQLAQLDDLATIIYTSGTTGRPKGAELTHGNFSILTRSAVTGLKEVVGPGSRTLLFMPLAHVFARFIEVLCVPAGSVLGHTPDAKNLLADLASFQPTFILSVPRVFEKVYNSSEQKAAAGGKLKIFRWAAATSITYSRALETPGGPGIALRLQHKAAGVLVYGKLRTALGGRAEWAISGGAPLGERLGHFYRGIGLRVLEGYGLTETTAPATVNLPDKTKIGTVGPPLPGHSVRIAADGEIELKGPNVFRGYHNNPSATAESFDDGWFRTGDLGSLDDDGFLQITGRKKEIIVTAGGKNVAPAVLEDRLRSHPLISQVVVVGDARPFIAALVTLDPDGLPGWLIAHSKAPITIGEARTDPDVLASVAKAVERANRAVSRAESIRKFRILDTDLTIANGYLTPKLSVRRAEVMKGFATEVDALYNDDSPR